MAEPDYILDIGGSRPPDELDRPQARPPSRPFISVHFDCCKVFARIYLNGDGTAFVGWCPRCACKVVATVSPDGTTARIFRAR